MDWLDWDGFAGGGRDGGAVCLRGKFRGGGGRWGVGDGLACVGARGSGGGWVILDEDERGRKGEDGLEVGRWQFNRRCVGCVGLGHWGQDGRSTSKNRCGSEVLDGGSRGVSNCCFQHMSVCIELEL